MTESSDNDGTWALWVIAIAIVAVVMFAAIDNEHDEQVTRSCMDNVHTPTPEATDYDQQSQDFAVEIRKCLRA